MAYRRAGAPRRDARSIMTVEWDEQLAAEFKRALAAAGRTLRRDIGRVNRSAGAVMAREARRRAPSGRPRQSVASGKYGPLGRARGMAGAGDAGRAGVRAAYYYHFVRAGVAGRNRARAGPRPFVEESIRATAKEWLEVLRRGVRRALNRHINVSVEASHSPGPAARARLR